MTLIEVSEKIRDHLIKQKAKSEDSVTGACKYRSENGLMCAVGCLINDEHYSPMFEGLIAINTNILGAVQASGIEVNDGVTALVRGWQCYHDHSCDGYSYRTWLELGSDNHSPEAYHTFITQED
jgi:hypothetical protein